MCPTPCSPSSTGTLGLAVLLQPVTTFGKPYRSNLVREIIPREIFFGEFCRRVQDLMLSSHLDPVDRHGLKVLDPNWSQPGKPANQILRALSRNRACGHRPRAYLRKVSSSGPLKRHSGKPTNRSGRRRRCTPCPVAAPSSSPSSSLANFMSQMLEIRELS